MTRVLTRSILPFVLLAATIITCSWFVINSTAFAERPSLLALASTIDLTLFIPAVWFLCIRKTKIPKLTVIPIFVLSMVLAGQLIPSDYQQALSYIEYLIPLIELFVISVIFYNVRKTAKAYNKEKQAHKKRLGFLETVHEATQKAYGASRIATVFATEISIFNYAIVGWNPQIEAPKAHQFTYHKESGYYAFFGMILFALVAETAVFHLLLIQWSAVAAWILTGLSIYSVFFVLGDFNAIRKRPVYLTDDSLVVRVGLRWRVTIPYTEIAAVELRVPDKEKEEFANFIVAGEANTVLELKSETTANGLYGFTKKFTRLALNMDNRHSFEQELNARIAVSAD